MALRDTLLRIEDYLDQGDVEAAGKLRQQLADECPEVDPTDPTACFSRARVADLALMMLDREAATTILEPYLNREPGVADPRTDIMEQLDQLPRAAVESACANTLYRFRQYQPAQTLVDTALKRFDLLGGGTCGDRNVQIGRMWTLAYAARIAWRASNDSHTVERYIDKCLSSIEYTRAHRIVDAPRLISLEAFVLDLRAFTLWLLGNVPLAMAWAYKGLTLLTSRRVPVNDHARRGQALLTTGRIEATLSSTERFHDAYELLDEATKEFGLVEHPLRQLAELERVRLVIRSGDLRLAAAELGPIARLDEHPVLASEYDLTQCWLLQADRERTRQKQNAERQCEYAERIVAAEAHLPRRLALEGRLQRGMALIKSGKVGDGIKELRALQETANELGRERLEAACLLELAAACNGEASERLYAHRYFEQANEIIVRASSAYLFRRREEVERLLRIGGIGWFYHVQTMKHSEALGGFQREFFSRALKLYGSVRNVARVTRAAPGTVSSWTEGAGDGKGKRVQRNAEEPGRDGQTQNERSEPDAES